jgi:dihydrofolate reductase
MRMPRIVLTENLTLDGVMQAPGRPDEDTRGGFEHGGWGLPYNDEVMGREMGKRMTGGGSLLLGRRTYEDFASFWPNQPDNPYTRVLNERQKYVVSSTLEEPLPWENSTLVRGDLAELKEQADGDLGVLGSGQLARELMDQGLVDEYVLLIYPLVLGSGTRLFAGDGPMSGLELIDSVTTTKGVVIATYRPA